MKTRVLLCGRYAHLDDCPADAVGKLGWWRRTPKLMHETRARIVSVDRRDGVMLLYTTDEAMLPNAGWGVGTPQRWFMLDPVEGALWIPKRSLDDRGIYDERNARWCNPSREHFHSYPLAGTNHPLIGGWYVRIE